MARRAASTSEVTVMTKQHKLALMIRFGLGAAILAAAAVSSGSTCPQSVICSASGDFGRQAARVSVSGRDPTVCIREFLGGSAQGLPSCWEAVRINDLPCVDRDGTPNIVDLPR